MVGVFIRNRDESSVYLSFSKDRITVGTAQSCDLVLRDARGIAEEHCTLSYEPRGWHVEATAEILIDGRPFTGTTTIADGATLAVGEYMIDLAFERTARWRVTVDVKERELLAAIANKDHASREIYADWLEEQDQRDKSTYLRMQQRVFEDADIDIAFSEARKDLRTAAERLDPRWRRAVAQLPIEGCSPEFECPNDWSALDATKEPAIRQCRVCDKGVYFCSTLGKAYDLVMRTQRVVVDVVEPRRPQDLEQAHNRARMLRARR